MDDLELKWNLLPKDELMEFIYSNISLYELAEEVYLSGIHISLLSDLENNIDQSEDNFSLPWHLADEYELLNYFVEAGIKLEERANEIYLYGGKLTSNIIHLEELCKDITDIEYIFYEYLCKLDYETIVEIEFLKGNPNRIRKIESSTQNKRTGLLEKIVYGEEYSDPVELFVFFSGILEVQISSI